MRCSRRRGSPSYAARSCRWPRGCRGSSPGSSTSWRGPHDHPTKPRAPPLRSSTRASAGTPKSMSVEEVVLLDEDGNAIGTAAKAAVHGTVTPLPLAFSCYVFDGAGRLLVTQRALDKPTFGGVW